MLNWLLFVAVVSFANFSFSSELSDSQSSLELSLDSSDDYFQEEFYYQPFDFYGIVNALLSDNSDEFFILVDAYKSLLTVDQITTLMSLIDPQSTQFKPFVALMEHFVNFQVALDENFEGYKDKWYREVFYSLHGDEVCNFESLKQFFITGNIKAFFYLLQHYHVCKMASELDDKFLETLIAHTDSAIKSDALLQLFQSYPKFIPFYSHEILLLIGKFPIAEKQLKYFMQKFHDFDDRLLLQVALDTFDVSDYKFILNYYENVKRADCQGLSCMPLPYLEMITKFLLSIGDFEVLESIPIAMYTSHLAENMIQFYLANVKMEKLRILKEELKTSFSIRIDSLSFRALTYEELLEFLNIYSSMISSSERLCEALELVQRFEVKKSSSDICDIITLTMDNMNVLLAKKGFMYFMTACPSSHLIISPYSYHRFQFTKEDLKELIGVCSSHFYKVLRSEYASRISSDIFSVFQYAALELDLQDEIEWELYKKAHEIVINDPSLHFIPFHGFFAFDEYIKTLISHKMIEEVYEALKKPGFEQKSTSLHQILALMANLFESDQFDSIWIKHFSGSTVLACEALSFSLETRMDKKVIEALYAHCNRRIPTMHYLEFAKTSIICFQKYISNQNLFTTLETWKIVMDYWNYFSDDYKNEVIENKHFFFYATGSRDRLIDMNLLNFFVDASLSASKCIYRILEEKESTHFLEFLALLITSDNKHEAIFAKLGQIGKLNSVVESIILYFYETRSLELCLFLTEKLNIKFNLERFLISARYSSASIISAVLYLIDKNRGNLIDKNWLEFLPLALFRNATDEQLILILRSQLLKEYLRPFYKKLLLNSIKMGFEQSYLWLLANCEENDTDARLEWALISFYSFHPFCQLELVSEQPLTLNSSLAISLLEFTVHNNAWDQLMDFAEIDCCSLWIYLCLESDLNLVDSIVSNMKQVLLSEDTVKCFDDSKLNENMEILLQLCFMSDKEDLLKKLLELIPKEAFRKHRWFTKLLLDDEQTDNPFVSFAYSLLKETFKFPHQIPTRISVVSTLPLGTIEERFELIKFINQPFYEASPIYFESNNSKLKFPRHWPSSFLLRTAKVTIIYKDLGSVSVDSNGLLRDWLHKMTAVIVERVFEQNEEGRLIPSWKSSLNASFLLESLGKIMGVCILSGNQISLPLSKLIFVMLRGTRLKRKHLKLLDRVFYTNLRKDLSSSDLMMNEVVFRGKEYEIPAIKAVAVTAENQKQYKNLVASTILLDYQKILKPMIDAFHDLISIKSLKLLKGGKELEMLLCGTSVIDLEDWKKNSNSYCDSEFTELFWKVVESFSRVERSLLLKFVHGSDIVPAAGFSQLMGANMPTPFTINCVEGMSLDSLPTASTCFNVLYIPRYNSFETLKEKLLLAISNSVEFTEL